MSTPRMLADWIYAAVLAALLLSYGASLVSQAVSAHAAEGPGVCMLTPPPSTN